jgi:glycine/serine hydroxymethyltransferase
MTIDVARKLLLDGSADANIIQCCINELRREARYVRYATKINHRSDFAGKEALDEIENLIYELAEKLMDILQDC